MSKIFLESHTGLDGEVLNCRVTILSANLSPWLVKKAKGLGFQDAENPEGDLTHICHSSDEHKLILIKMSPYFDKYGRWIEPIKVSARCPKCQSDTIELHEVVMGINTWQVDGGMIIGNGDAHPCDPVKVLGECLKCKHTWRVRKASQINDCYAENR